MVGDNLPSSRMTSPVGNQADTHQHARGATNERKRCGYRRPVDQEREAATRQEIASHGLDPEVMSAIVRAVQAEVIRQPPLPRLLTQREVIKALRTSRSAFHRLRTGQIAGAQPFPEPRYVGAHPRWIAAEVEAWIMESTDRPV